MVLPLVIHQTDDLDLSQTQHWEAFVQKWVSELRFIVPPTMSYRDTWSSSNVVEKTLDYQPRGHKTDPPLLLIPRFFWSPASSAFHMKLGNLCDRFCAAILLLPRLNFQILKTLLCKNLEVKKLLDFAGKRPWLQVWRQQLLALKSYLELCTNATDTANANTQVVQQLFLYILEWQ